jgi:putative FmdB family regulatory protein
MPNYQFVCVECDDTVDVFFPITEKHQEVDCEKCGNPRKKQLGLGAIAFKGGGWAHKEY